MFYCRFILHIGWRTRAIYWVEPVTFTLLTLSVDVFFSASLLRVTNYSHWVLYLRRYLKSTCIVGTCCMFALIVKYVTINANHLKIAANSHHVSSPWQCTLGLCHIVLNGTWDFSIRSFFMSMSQIAQYQIAAQYKCFYYHQNLEGTML